MVKIGAFIDVSQPGDGAGDIQEEPVEKITFCYLGKKHLKPAREKFEENVKNALIPGARLIFVHNFYIDGPHIDTPFDAGLRRAACRDGLKKLLDEFLVPPLKIHNWNHAKLAREIITTFDDIVFKVEPKDLAGWRECIYREVLMKMYDVELKKKLKSGSLKTLKSFFSRQNSNCSPTKIQIVLDFALG